MLLDYNRDKLRRALSDFSNTTGLNIDFADCNFSQLMLHKLNHCSYCSAIFNTPDGNSGCIHSDMELFLKCRESGKPEKRVCHAGLLDVAIPIFHGSLLLGYVIFGQMRTEPDFSKLAKSIEHLNLDFEKMEKYYNELPIYNDEKIQSVVNVAVMLTKYVLFENMLIPSVNKNIEKAIKFIDLNLNRPMDVHTLSKSINISKTTIYEIFREYFNCTVNEYINTKRIERAADLLLKSDMSIGEISEAVGISTASYFTKLFKKQKGLPPLKFKKRFKDTV